MESPSQDESDASGDDYTEKVNQSVSFIGQSHDFFTRVKADHFLKMVRGAFAANGQACRVLDIGSGHGFIHPYLLAAKDLRLEITGIDIAATAIDEARKRNPSVSYDSHDGMTLPYADESFSVASAICVMHHVPPQQWTAFLREMRRVLKPSGLAMIFEHNPLNPLTRRVVRSCALDDDAVLVRSGHLKSMMSETGFSEVDGRFILFSPFDKPFFRGLDGLLGWLPLGAQYLVVARRPG